MKRALWVVAIAGSTLFGACDDDGEGSASFTTWGEEYIEEGIPADPSGEEGFVDGWSIQYEKFLVVFHQIEVGDSDGHVAASSKGSFLVDNVVPGIKELVSFPKLDAKRWDRVSYQIKPADEDTEVVAGDQDDLAFMLDNNYSLYVEGSASKTVNGSVTRKTFRWGFSTATQYKNCQQAEDSGQALEGITVTNGGDEVSELTTHGDHLFYDRLMASDDPAVKTSLRFEEKAAADTNDDGEVTLDELFAARIDVRLYDPSGLRAPNLGAFMTSLVRTVGHFRGEGECSISEL